MPTRRSTPKLRRHKPSRQAVVTLNGRDHYLGPWPDGHKSPAADVRDAYDALVAEWLANGRRPPPRRHACRTLRRRTGPPVLGAVRLRLLPPPRRVADHRAGQLQALPPPPPAAVRRPAGGRLLAAQAEGRPPEHGRRRGQPRGRQPAGRPGPAAVQVGVAEELVPEPVYRALAAVEGLKAGRSEARETRRVEPVADEHVDAACRSCRRPSRRWCGCSG
jgi:hypothetical protein